MNLNVLIYISPPFVIERITTDKNGKKKKTYTGLLYEIWSIIKKNLVEKKVIEGYKETFVDSKKMGLNDVHKLVIQGKYDICIAYFSVVKNRTKTQFTRPIYLNKYALAYLPNETDIMIILKGITYGFFKPVLFIIITALIIVTIFKYLPNNYLPKKWRSNNIWEMITALVFKSTGKFSSKPNPVNFIILLLSLLFGVYLIGEMTTTLSDIKKKIYNNKIDKDTIVGKKILTPKGYGSSNHWKKYGAIIEESNSNNILKEYEENTNKYFGFFDDFEILKSYKIKNNKLVISQENFGYDEIAWAVTDNQKLHKVLYEINNQIVLLQNNNIIMNLCKIYFFNDSYLCEL